LLYHAYDAWKGMLKFQFNSASLALGLSSMAFCSAQLFSPMPELLKKTADDLAAASGALGKLAKPDATPAFNLTNTVIGGKATAVHEETISEKPYCSLLRFHRDTNRNDPKILLVAPMSGNFPALLRETIETLLPDHDVYITNWKNARDVPLSAGEFDLTNDYLSYLKDFIQTMGPNTHVMGISQSTVPLLSAVALLAADNDPCQPLSCTLIAGPVDTRVGETDINRFAKTYPMDWFASHFIAKVPEGYAGAGQSVCPGFLQQGGFALANPAHLETMHRFNRLSGKTPQPADDYESLHNAMKPTMDSSRPFFLETIWHAFKNHSLPRGLLRHKGQTIDPAAIRHTALFTIEGGRDSIVGPGQTAAAQFMCKNLPATLKFHHSQPDAGHYDVFKGRSWRENIAPRLVSFIRASAAAKNIEYDPVSGGKNGLEPQKWSLADASPALLSLYSVTNDNNKIFQRHGPTSLIA
jgi:poly(3-hydroxybutyrate) depolymerase